MLLPAFQLVKKSWHQYIPWYQMIRTGFIWHQSDHRVSSAWYSIPPSRVSFDLHSTGKNSARRSGRLFGICCIIFWHASRMLQYSCSIQLIQLTLQCKYKPSKTFDKFYASQRSCAWTLSHDSIMINKNLTTYDWGILPVNTPFHKQAYSKKHY